MSSLGDYEILNRIGLYENYCGDEQDDHAYNNPSKNLKDFSQPFINFLREGHSDLLAGENS